jgi:hypothetical protein
VIHRCQGMEWIWKPKHSAPNDKHEKDQKKTWISSQKDQKYSTTRGNAKDR